MNRKGLSDGKLSALLNTAVNTVRRQMRRVVEEPDPFPFLFGLPEIFRLVQQGLDPLAWIGGIGIDQAACGAAEGHKPQNSQEDSRHDQLSATTVPYSSEARHG